jgi:glutathione S-transferase
MGLQETPDDPVGVTAREGATRYYGEMERVLAGGDFLAGHYTYADIAFYMAHVFGSRMGAPMGSITPKLLQWRDRMSARPAVREVVGPMAAYVLSLGRPLPDFLRELAA